jgi:hypothetical protein
VNGYYALAKDTYPAVSEAYAENAVSNWTQRTQTNTSNAICWSAKYSVFVACGPGSSKISTSSNGINWVQRVTPATYPDGITPISAGSNLNSVTWSRELNLFVAVGVDVVIYSIDGGVTWSNNFINLDTGLFNNLSCISWSKELNMFIVISSNQTNNLSYYSYNGIDWFSNPTGFNNTWRGCCWSPELSLFLAVSWLGSVGQIGEFDRVMTSPDGINWTLRTDPLLSGKQGLACCWSSYLGLFIFIGDVIFTSPDGINWTQRAQSLTLGENYRSIAWSPELQVFVAPALGAEQKVIVSNNGINWVKYPIPLALTWQGIEWSPELGIFVAVSTSTNVLTSSLQARTPTSYNVFNSPFNSIDQNGNWTIQQVLKGASTTNSGATPNVAGLNLYYVSNSGSTTITNLTGGTQYQQLAIVFGNSNTIIQSNTNIRLNNGNNFVATNNDTLTLLFINSIWVEICRSVNAD